MWVTDYVASAIFRLDDAGAIIQTIPTPPYPGKPTFDGVNIWVPSSTGLLVIRAATGEIVATLGGDQLPTSGSAAFDGSRVLVVDGPLFSLWNAQSLASIGTFETGLGSDSAGCAATASTSGSRWILRAGRGLCWLASDDMSSGGECGRNGSGTLVEIVPRNKRW